MMKKFLLIMLLAIPVGMAAQAPKFGHFKSYDLLTTLPEFTQIQNELEKARKTHEDEYKRIANEFQKNLEDFTAAKDSLPVNIADRRQKELQDMGQKVQEYAQFAQQDLEQLENKLMTPISTKLNNAVKAVGDNEGMIYIFDLSRMPVAYVNEKQSVDVTNAIKAQLGIK